jgi:hypothetical protein
VYGGMQVRTSHLPCRALQLLAFDYVLLQSSKLTTPSSTMMHVAIEGPDNDFDDILTSALDLWKDDAKFRYLYSNPERYLSGASDVALEEVP